MHDPGFCCKVNEICTLPRYYAVSVGNSLPTFWDNLSDPSAGVKKSKKQAGNSWCVVYIEKVVG